MVFLGKTSLHPGWWEAHAAQYTDEQYTEVAAHPEPCRGKICAYGIILWENEWRENSMTKKNQQSSGLRIVY